MIRYGHPTYGEVDYGPANGRPRSVGAAPTGARPRRHGPFIRGERIATPPAKPHPATYATCCGEDVIASYPCPHCGAPCVARTDRADLWVPRTEVYLAGQMRLEIGAPTPMPAKSSIRTMLDGRTEAIWSRYKDCTRGDLLEALRRNQRAGRYLVAGDMAAIRASLERGQTVSDLGINGLRKILDERFEYVTQQQREAAR